MIKNKANKARKEIKNQSSTKDNTFVAPKLYKHGKLSTLTKAKHGGKSDGGGVPRTRL